MLDEFIALVEQVRANPDPQKAIIIMVKGMADSLFKSAHDTEQILRLGYTLDEHAANLAAAVFANSGKEVAPIPEAPQPTPKAKTTTQKTAKTGKSPTKAPK